MGRVHAVVLQPADVLRGVPADRADQQRLGPEGAHAEGDVGARATAADLEIAGQEGQRHVAQLLREQRVGEPALEGEQVVGGDGSGDGDAHPGTLAAYLTTLLISRPWVPAGNSLPFAA
jgi:hypothetical protein